jgi:hypothetical protein
LIGHASSAEGHDWFSEPAQVEIKRPVAKNWAKGDRLVGTIEQVRTVSVVETGRVDIKN